MHMKIGNLFSPWLLIINIERDQVCSVNDKFYPSSYVWVHYDLVKKVEEVRETKKLPTWKRNHFKQPDAPDSLDVLMRSFTGNIHMAILLYCYEVWTPFHKSKGMGAFT